MRPISRAEFAAAWLCGGGLLLALLAWRASWPETVIWIGGGIVVAGLLLWIRGAKRRFGSKWTKENEDV